MKAHSIRSHHSGRQLACVQGDVHLGVKQMERMDHLHLQPIVGHGDAPVFGLHHVDANNQRVGGRAGNVQAQPCS